MYLRKYKGEESWEKVSTVETRKQLAKSFQDVELVLDVLKDGRLVETAFAIYKKERR